jgi:hypothetical protein
MNSRILFLTTLLAFPLGVATAADEAIPTKAVEAEASVEGAPSRLRRPARFAQLEQLLEAGRAEVALLVEQLRAAETPELQNTIETQIVAAKKAQRERFLTECLLMAEASGDLVQAEEARSQLDHLRNKNNGQQILIERPLPSLEGPR